MRVRDFGAIAGGTHDCTSAFQAALEEAGNTGGVVHVPAGIYRIDGVLRIPPGVTLEGNWPGPHTSQLDKGSTLMATAGRDREAAPPLISLATGSTVKGLTIFYPEQTAADIRPYPWTIQGRGQHFNVIDVTIANAYNGIDCGSFHNEGHHLRNVHICALRRGVLIDQCSDIGRLENVHIHNVYYWRMSAPYTPTAADNAALEAFTRENLEGFIIGRTDWEYMSNCFVIWARVGFRFIKTGTPVGGTGNVLVTQSGSDIGPLAVQVEAVQEHAGVAFENCQFMSGFTVGPGNKGPIKLTNCGFWGKSASGSNVTLNGDNTTTLTAVHFDEWENGTPCIEATAGSLLMNGCDFVGKPDSGPHIRLGSQLASAAIIGNRFRHGPIRIVNESSGDVQTLGNVAG